MALVHLAMAFYVDSVTTAILDLVTPLLGQEAALLAVSLTAWLPLLVVVLLWARVPRLGWIAVAVGVFVATLGYLRGVVVESLLDTGNQDQRCSSTTGPRGR